MRRCLSGLLLSVAVCLGPRAAFAAALTENTPIRPARSDSVPALVILAANQSVVVDAKCAGWLKVHVFTIQADARVYVSGWIPATRLKERVGASVPEDCGPDAETAGLVSAGAVRYPTSFTFRVGPVVTWNRYQFVSDAENRLESEGPFSGVSATADYWFESRFGSRVTFSSASTRGLSTDLRDPTTGDAVTVEGIRASVTDLSADFRARTALGRFEGRGALGYRLLDVRIDPVVFEDLPIHMVGRRYTGGTISGELARTFGSWTVEADASVWVVTVVSEAFQDPDSGRSISGRPRRVNGATLGGHAARRVSSRFGVSGHIGFTRLAANFEGDGLRFGEEVANATTAETVVSATLALRFMP